MLGTERKEPNRIAPEDFEMWQRVEMALERIRPMLQADGGDIELLEVKGNSITVKLVGACSSCPSSVITLREGVERVLREEIPEIGEMTVV